MKNFLPILLLLTLSSSLLIGNHFMANGQLIIDENDPSGQRIIHLLMDTINDYQHKHSDNHDYKLKRLVYTFGESPKYSVELIVIDDQTKQVSCLLLLFIVHLTFNLHFAFCLHFTDFNVYGGII